LKVNNEYLRKIRKDDYDFQKNKREQIEQKRLSHNKYNSEWRKRKYRTDPEYKKKYLEYKRAWDKEHYPINRRDLKYHYGLSIDDYNALLKKQDGKCAICGAEKADKRGRRLEVDHDRITKKIRGLLCHKCNFGLGCFNHDADLLSKASEYMRRNQTLY
jgi:hypothetical protein